MIYDLLNEALDQLIQGEQKRIIREYDRPGHKTERVSQLSTLPSLWEQLNAATAYQGNGGNSVGKSRLPITAGAVDLVNEITAWAREGLTKLPPTPNGKRRDRDDIPSATRAIAADIISTHDEGRCSDWTKQLREWAGKIRRQLGLDPQHPEWARGTRCPECGARNATTDNGGEEVRTPALAINWSPPDDTTTYPPDPWIVRAVECRACNKAWFRGADLEQLVDSMLTANRTLETMTELTCVECGKHGEDVETRNCIYAQEVHRIEEPEDICDACEQWHSDNI